MLEKIIQTIGKRESEAEKVNVLSGSFLRGGRRFSKTSLEFIPLGACTFTANFTEIWPYILHFVRYFVMDLYDDWLTNQPPCLHPTDEK